MLHIELSFVGEDVQVESEATSQNGELKTLHYVKQDLGGGSKAESFVCKEEGPAAQCVQLLAELHVKLTKSGVFVTKDSASIGAEARGGTFRITV
jgi:hypothetical protein